MFDEDPIPVREQAPDYPTEFQGKRLLGIDAYHHAHYWRGDRIEVMEKNRILSRENGDAVLNTEYETVGIVQTDDVTGGPGEYLRSVGTYLDDIVDDDADPVYAADHYSWEWISEYARDLASDDASYGAADSPSDSRYGQNMG
ncbi:hypothetical protein [Halostella pelagica]|uniref:hypothetical protein n=1 Tax=Halostella pelagica TaxID=2583824 RepID=UPI001080CC0C|nr:hypothetical protein [Halostella pelagica]